jgi:hypothetical protein
MTSIELTVWLETISKIIFDIKISLTNAERLFEVKYDNEENIKNHGFFRHNYYQLWFIMTIQICKLLTKSKNQKFNFHLLFDRLLSEPIDTELSDLIIENSRKPFVRVFRSTLEFKNAITILKQQLKLHEQVILKLKTSRDTLYAHRDHNAKPQNVTLDDVNSLLNFCIETHNTIRGGFYDASVNYNHTSSWNIDYVLKKCSLAGSAKRN